MMPMYNPTVARISLRALLGRRRAVLLLPLPALLILLVLPVRGSTDAEKWTTHIVGELGVGVILPLVALILATSVLGSELEDGSAVQLLAKPIPRRDIVFTKLVVVFAVTALVTALPVYLAGVIATADSTGLSLGYAAGSIVGAAVYCSIFVALSVLTRRAVAVGLVYVLLWEGLLADLLSGTRVFSVQAYVTRFADAVASSPALQPRISMTVAIVMSVLIVVGATALATDRLRSFSLEGDSA